MCAKSFRMQLHCFHLVGFVVLTANLYVVVCVILLSIAHRFCLPNFIFYNEMNLKRMIETARERERDAEVRYEKRDPNVHRLRLLHQQ